MGLVEFVVYGWLSWLVLGLFLLFAGLVVAGFILYVKCDSNEYRCIRLGEIFVYAMIGLLYVIVIVLCLGSLLGMVSIR